MSKILYILFKKKDNIGGNTRKKNQYIINLKDKNIKKSCMLAVRDKTKRLLIELGIELKKKTN